MSKRKRDLRFSAVVDLIELRVALCNHCRALRKVLEQLKKDQLAGAVRTLDRTTARLERLSRAQAARAGLRPASKSSARRGRRSGS